MQCLLVKEVKTTKKNIYISCSGLVGEVRLVVVVMMRSVGDLDKMAKKG